MQIGEDLKLFHLYSYQSTTLLFSSAAHKLSGKVTKGMLASILSVVEHVFNVISALKENCKQCKTSYKEIFNAWYMLKLL